nr:hypothetical protein [Tanacetum cinerariifolium]
MLPVAAPSPDYIPGPEEPQTPPVPQDEDEHKPMFIQPHDPDYIPEPMYPKYIPLEDEHVLLAEEQPLPPIDSPTTESSGYVAESDLEEDLEEYEDDEPEDGLVNYPMDGGHDGDDDDDNLFREDTDDEDEDEEEEEHLASADTAVVVPTVEPDHCPALGFHIPSTKGRGRETSSHAYPPPSPLTSPSPPSAGERLARCTAPSACPSPPPVPSPLLPSSGCPTQIQTLKLASTQALIDVVTTALPLPPIPPPIDHRDDIPETEMPPRKRLCLSTLGSRYEIGESSTGRPIRGRGIDYGFVSTLDAEARRRGIGEVGYGIRDTWVDPAEVVPEIAPMTMREVNTMVIELAELHEHVTQDLYALLEDAQDSRTRISQRVTMDSQQVDLLMEDRIANQETILIVEEEAYAAREAWAHSIGLSHAVYFELQTHREQASYTDGRDSPSDGDMRQEMSDLQAELRIMAHVTRQGPNIPHNNTNPKNVTPESIQAMINQALLRKSTNGNESHSSHEDNRRNVQTTRPCFYTDFMKCQPLNFKGTEGVVKFATCTLLDAALTWWNSQIRSLGPDAYLMTWEVLKKKMTDMYYLQGEIKELEIDLWNLKVKGNDVPAYTKRFQELTLICTKFVANEIEKIDKQTNNKRKVDESFKNNHGRQQQPVKRQNVTKIYNMGLGEKKPYEGNLPKCTKCYFYHNGPCTQKCHKCNKLEHFARDCRSSGNANVANAQRNNAANPKGNGCFECGAPGHFKRDCPKLKNKDEGNVNAQGWVYAVGNAEKKRNASRDPDSNVVTGTFLLNNRYASILFNTGADRSFISTAFSSLIDIVPTPLGNSYDVRLADSKIAG